MTKLDPKPESSIARADSAASPSEPGQAIDQTGYLADPAFINELRVELGDVCAEYGPLLFAPGPPRPSAWARDIWRHPRRIPAPSINQAIRSLKRLNRDWALYSFSQHRRAQLIQEGLPKLRERSPWTFGQALPTRRLGSWTLIDKESIIASADCRSPLPLGELHFVEEKSGPPSRAYLKLWEALSLMNEQPKPGERCIDLGASPGGWTWVLAELGAEVLAIDRAPLAPKVAARPNVQWQKGNAFGMTPEELGPVDWLFSDVICYPEKLLELVHRWRSSRLARKIVVTIKFQGATDHEVARAFAALPNGELRHLFHNKHELCWMGSGLREDPPPQA